jgi:hypothetical protein
MKMRLLLALAGLTISFALPTIAQEKEEVNPKILAGIQANDKAYDDAFNKHDPAAIAALFSENAVLVIRGEVAREIVLRHRVTRSVECLPGEQVSRKGTPRCLNCIISRITSTH